MLSWVWGEAEASSEAVVALAAGGAAEAELVRLLDAVGVGQLDPIGLSAPDRDGMTAVHWCGWHGWAQAVPRLLAQGAALDTQNIHGHTALHLACCRGHSAAALVLLSCAASHALVDCLGRSAFDHALSSGLGSVCRELMLRGDGPRNPAAGPPGPELCAELCAGLEEVAAVERSAAAVLVALRLGGEPSVAGEVPVRLLDRPVPQLPDGWSSLHLAAPLLHHAAARGCTPVVQALLEAGASAVLLADGRPPAEFAADRELAQILSTAAAAAAAAISPEVVIGPGCDLADRLVPMLSDLSVDCCCWAAELDCSRLAVLVLPVCSELDFETPIDESLTALLARHECSVAIMHTSEPGRLPLPRHRVIASGVLSMASASGRIERWVKVLAAAVAFHQVRRAQTELFAAIGPGSPGRGLSAHILDDSHGRPDLEALATLAGGLLHAGVRCSCACLCMDQDPAELSLPLIAVLGSVRAVAALTARLMAARGRGQPVVLVELDGADELGPACVRLLQTLSRGQHTQAACSPAVCLTAGLQVQHCMWRAGELGWRSAALVAALRRAVEAVDAGQQITALQGRVSEFGAGRLRGLREEFVPISPITCGELDGLRVHVSPPGY